MAHFNAAKNDETSDPLNIDSNSKPLPQENGWTSLCDCGVTLKLLGHQLDKRHYSSSVPPTVMDPSLSNPRTEVLNNLTPHLIQAEEMEL